MPRSAAIDRFLEELSRRALAFYGERLVSLAVFGSHASGRARPRSDLDLFIVLGSAAPRRRLRLDEFDRLEDELAPALETAEADGWALELSPVIRTREEAERFSILYLDMTLYVRLLVDRDDFLRRRLERLRRELDRLGAERRTLGDSWYWILKRDYRPGEVFEISCPAFYGNENFVPSDEYDVEDSSEAIGFAETIIGWVSDGLAETGQGGGGT